MNKKISAACKLYYPPSHAYENHILYMIIFCTIAESHNNRTPVFRLMGLYAVMALKDNFQFILLISAYFCLQLLYGITLFLRNKSKVSVQPS